MVQFPRMIRLHDLTQTAILAVGLFLNGCTTINDSAVRSVNSGYVVSGQRDPGPKHADPFRQPDRSEHLKVGLVPSAAPFAWHTVATTALGEPLETISAGDGVFHSLVIGSVGGNDTVAVNLTEELACYLHRNQLVMGGVRATVLRTLNPDGMRRDSYKNGDGCYLNELFPDQRQVLSPLEVIQLPKEIRFLIDHVHKQRPQRIIHIRTVRGSRGLLAVSRGALDSGREVAEWLNFELRTLPGDVNRRTLESWAAQRGDSDVITFGLPRRTDSDDVWALYGDAVLTLLLDGNLESRRVLRRAEREESNNRSDEEIFLEDPVSDAVAGINTPLFD